MILLWRIHRIYWFAILIENLFIFEEYFYTFLRGKRININLA